MDVAHYHYYNFAICLEPYQNIQKTSRVKTMKLQAAYGPLQFDPKNHQVHLTAQLNWKTPHDSLLIFWMNLFFLPPQNIILSGGTKFCKWWWFHPYVLKSFPTRKVGGSDDSSYPNLTTCKSAHMFFSKLSWLKLNHQEFADLLWVDPTRSWTWKQTDRGLAIALPEAGLARGWRPTDPLGRNDMFFFQMVFFNDARPLLSIAFVKLLEKLGGIWTWLPIKINTMFFFDIFYWHFI